MAAVGRARAYEFRSDLSLAEMKVRLDAAWPSPRMERDSETKPDSISGALTSEASARICHIGRDLFVVNLGFRSDDRDAAAQLERARRHLLDGALPIVDARAVTPCDPIDQAAPKAALSHSRKLDPRTLEELRRSVSLR